MKDFLWRFSWVSAQESAKDSFFLDNSFLLRDWYILRKYFFQKRSFFHFFLDLSSKPALACSVGFNSAGKQQTDFRRKISTLHTPIQLKSYLVTYFVDGIASIHLDKVVSSTHVCIKPWIGSTNYQIEWRWSLIFLMTNQLSQS